MDDKEKRYSEFMKKVLPILQNTEDLISSMASISSLFKDVFPDTLWVGFYRAAGNKLLVGPYQGKLGCSTIEFGRGVCGRAALEKKTQVVKDVHKFEGHIACDCRANSEIVVPVFDLSGKIIAVLDIDSEEFAKFDETDRIKLEHLVTHLKDKSIIT